MADITRASVGLDTISAINGGLRISEVFAGEALTAGDAVYIKSDGLVWKAVSTATEALNQAAFVGLVARDYAVGQPVTIFGQGNVFQYAAGMTPGTLLYASAVAGNLGDAKVATADTAKARIISATAIVVL